MWVRIGAVPVLSLRPITFFVNSKVPSNDVVGAPTTRLAMRIHSQVQKRKVPSALVRCLTHGNGEQNSALSMVEPLMAPLRQ